MTDAKFTFEESGLPALYYAANRVSQRSQKLYLSLFFAVLLLTVTAPLAIVLSGEFPCIARPMRFAAALCLVASMLITAGIKQSQKERSWYGARAVAESVKTLAWRFAMCAEPFSCSLPPDEAEAAFLKRLNEILTERAALNFSAAGDLNTGAQITSGMRRLRAENWQSRRSLYLASRVQEQRQWYSKKAKRSDAGESWFFFSILVLQLAAALSAFAFAAWSSLRVQITTFFTTATAAALAWLQVKRYQETSQSYALTAQELGFISARSDTIQSHEEFSQFVSDAEKAMSREHTLWVARREAK